MPASWGHSHMPPSRLLENDKPSWAADHPCLVSTVTLPSPSSHLSAVAGGKGGPCHVNLASPDPIQKSCGGGGGEACGRSLYSLPPFSSHSQLPTGRGEGLGAMPAIGRVESRSPCHEGPPYPATVLAEAEARSDGGQIPCLVSCLWLALWEPAWPGQTSAGQS